MPGRAKLYTLVIGFLIIIAGVAPYQAVHEWREGETPQALELFRDPVRLALSALVAGVVDLLWLGALAVMTCGRTGTAGLPHLDSQRRTEILRSLTLTRW